MRWIAPWIVLFVCLGSGWTADAPYVKLPDKLTVKPNRYFKIKADTNCKQVKWVLPGGLDSFPFGADIPQPPNIQVLIGDSGTYTIQAYGALGDQVSDIATCTVTVGTPPPPTPPPSALTETFQTAYSQDTDTDRAASLDFLIAAYSSMASAAPGWTTIHTNADALKQMQTVISAPTGLKPTQVKNLRTAIAAEFTKVFGTTSTALIDLTALAAELSKISNALKGVK